MNVIGGLFLLTVASAAVQSDEPPSFIYPAIPKTVTKVEEFVSPGWVIVSKAQGDLNRDGRSDVALALWTEEASKAEHYTITQVWPFYRLVIALVQPNGNYRLVTDSQSLLEPPGYSGGHEDPLAADNLRIVRGSLDISRELLRGHYRYRFRWSDNAFRLIGWEYGGSDGRCITETSINFLTRKATVRTEALDENGESRSFVRKMKGRLVTIDEASAEDYFPERDMVGPPTYCIYDGHRF